MESGKIKKMFPGNNTSEGFYSFYQYVNPDPVRTYLLKGGPGTGKSSLMKKLGARMHEKGFAVEYHYCSSDNRSLDGVVFPALGIAIIDGTRPHIMEPQYPGVVEEIINLGQYWDEQLLVRRKEDILKLSKQKARMFQLAYSHFKEARIAQEELESYYQDAQKSLEKQQLFARICREFGEKAQGAQGHIAALGSVRRLFASANTPDGYVHHCHSLLQDAETLYLLEGDTGVGIHELLEVLLRMGVGLGLRCEAYHCPFIPARLELVYFPALQTGFLYAHELLRLEVEALPHLQNRLELDFCSLFDRITLKPYRDDIAEARQRMEKLRKKGWAKLKEAQRYHQQLEAFYVEAVDFAGINAKREELLEKLLAYAD
ncbi:MAG: hypothetical protein ACOX23_00770 [Peptococcia bacterium]